MPRATARLQELPRNPKNSNKLNYGKGTFLTKPLGVYGWEKLEAILLAAIVSKTPLLLIGPHGCAKSYLLERLAVALNLEYRFYNASLINYDDLVGIPIPSEDKKSLEYIATPTSIWEAEVVFVDEINRSKPELQNKIFPIIHEKRVQGINLDKLHFRWAAMNPVSSEEKEDEVYLGAQQLDKALADRFGFIVEIPAWKDLSRKDKMAVLAGGPDGEPVFPHPIEEMIDLCQNRLNRLQNQENALIKNYLLILGDKLAHAGIRLSTRRITMLYANILAVRAAMETLQILCSSPIEPSWFDVARRTLINSIPQRAEDAALDSFQLDAAHMQAWALAENNFENSKDQDLLLISCPMERLLTAMRRAKSTSQKTLSATIIDFICDSTSILEQGARTLAFYVATQQHLTAPIEALDAMSDILSKILTPSSEIIAVKNKDRDEINELNKPVRPDCSKEGRMLNIYEKNLEQWVYKKNHSATECVNTRIYFRKMYRKIYKAIA